MSQENLEIVQAMYAEAAEGRFGTSLHLFHPDVEYSRSALGEGVWLVSRARGAAWKRW